MLRPHRLPSQDPAGHGQGAEPRSDEPKAPLEPRREVLPGGREADPRPAHRPALAQASIPAHISRPSQSKVRHFWFTRNIHQDVGGFQVSVNDAFLMCIRNGFGNLSDDRRCVYGRQWAVFDSIGQTVAFDKSHREIVLAVVFADFKDRHDPRMIQIRRRFRFRIEAFDIFLRCQLPGQNHFQGHDAVQIDLASFVPWGLEYRWGQFNCCNYNYYGNQEYNWSGATLYYTTLKNVIRMEEEAARSGAPAINPYSALGKFFRAYLFYEMTMRTGDLPMKEALLGVENLKPKYDTQKEIFLQIFKWLEDANNDLGKLSNEGGNLLQGDFYFNNDMKKWQKVINSFRLRVLVTLSKKESDADLKIKDQFTAIFADKTKYPIMTGMVDNLQFQYINPFNKYPVNPDNYGFDATRYNMSSTYIGLLTAFKDPRVFAVAEPAGVKLKAGLLPSDHAAFVGASPAEDLADMSNKAGLNNGPGFVPGVYSFYGRKRYYSTYTAEPTILIGYPEMCFNIAEAMNRGWLSGVAEEWYMNGIKASQGFYGVKDGANDFYYLKAGGKVIEGGDYTNYKVTFVFNDYYNQFLVKYNGNNSTGLDQILKQKYLAFFQHSGFEAYYNYRRTGIPDFAKGGPGTGNSGLIPKRFQYPSSERTTNGDNLNAALSSQFGGSDDINKEMWIIK